MRCLNCFFNWWNVRHYPQTLTQHLASFLHLASFPVPTWLLLLAVPTKAEQGAADKAIQTNIVTFKILMFWGQNRGSVCSTAELRQPDNHQPSQSSICTAQVVLNASATHLAATQYVPSECHFPWESVKNRFLLFLMLQHHWSVWCTVYTI